jgi:hypothetical protein
MPKLAYIGAFIVFMVAFDLQERRHVHVARTRNGFQRTAKFWLEPKVELFERGEFTDKELRQIAAALREHQGAIMAQIHTFAEGKKVTPLHLS